MLNIVVIGFNKSGIETTKQLIKVFGKEIQFTVIERQEAVFYNIGAPRAIVDESFAKQSFLAPTLFFTDPSQGKVIHASVQTVTEKNITLEDGTVIEFDYLVVASGSIYESPWKIQKPMKSEGLLELKNYCEKLKLSTKVVVIGGGPTGVEFAAEVKTYFPQKSVTIIQSGKFIATISADDKHRDRLLQKLDKMGIIVINEKVDKLPQEILTTGEHEVYTEKGTVVSSDFTIRAVGKITPNSSFMPTATLNENHFIKVKPTLQVDYKGFSNVFALGDVANTGAEKSFMSIDPQAALVANNIKAHSLKNNLNTYSIPISKLTFYSLGSKNGFGILPYTPGFISDFLAKTFKSKDLFLSRMASELKVKI